MTVIVTANEVDITATTGTTTAALTATGSTDAGELAYLEQDGDTDHVLTLNQTGDGSTQAALNAVSSNSSFSCVEVTGTETNRGTVKIAHKGYSDGSDSSAAAVSIDLQTTNGGSTGTAAQGIFITSTTDAIPGGDAICIRYNSQDWFAVKGSVGAGNGIVGIGIATGHTPAGMLEIAQKDTTTVGLFMEAKASGADLISLKDSGGTQRFQVNNSGNLVTRATALISTNMQVGATSASLGGGGNGCIGISKVSTAPSTNPTGVVLYVDSSGNLVCRTSAGNVRTVAAV